MALLDNIFEFCDISLRSCQVRMIDDRRFLEKFPPSANAGNAVNAHLPDLPQNNFNDCTCTKHHSHLPAVGWTCCCCPWAGPPAPWNWQKATFWARCLLTPAKSRQPFLLASPKKSSAKIFAELCWTPLCFPKKIVPRSWSCLKNLRGGRRAAIICQRMNELGGLGSGGLGFESGYP